MDHWLKFDAWARNSGFPSMMIFKGFDSTDSRVKYDDVTGYKPRQDWDYFSWNLNIYFRTREDMLMFKLQYR